MNKKLLFFATVLMFFALGCKTESKTPVIAGEWIGDTLLLSSTAVPVDLNLEDALIRLYGTMANFNLDSTFTLSTYTDSVAETTTGRWHLEKDQLLIIFTDTLMNVQSKDTFEFKINKLTADSLIVQALLDSLEIQTVFRKVGK